MEQKIAQWKKRPFSVSQLTMWEWKQEDWYNKYIVHGSCNSKICIVAGKKNPNCPVVYTNKEMQFGKDFAKAIEDAKKKNPENAFLSIELHGQKLVLNTYCKVEHLFKVNFNDITLVGYADTFCDISKNNIKDFKTTKTMWTQDKADKNPQALMYILMNYITNKIKPEDVDFVFECYLTQETGDFIMKFVEPIRPVVFKVHHSMKDILQMGARIKKARKEMEKWARSSPLIK